jgi:hypothetical protein
MIDLKLEVISDFLYKYVVRQKQKNFRRKEEIGLFTPSYITDAFTKYLRCIVNETHN